MFAFIRARIPINLLAPFSPNAVIGILLTRKMNYEHNHKFDLFLVRILHAGIILNISLEKKTPAIGRASHVDKTYIGGILLEPNRCGE